MKGTPICVSIDDFPNENAAWAKAIEQAIELVEGGYFQIEFKGVTLQRSHSWPKPSDEYNYIFIVLDPTQR